jgi:hypothetical protein
LSAREIFSTSIGAAAHAGLDTNAFIDPRRSHRGCQR